MNQEKIGKFIKEIRQERNLTQKEFAELLGVTFQAVSKWERGVGLPDLGTMKIISEKFNINIDEIINGKKNKKDNKKLILIIISILLVLLLLVGVTIKIKNNDDYEFKTISSKCSDFKITGSAAYNKDKATIYISNVEFCGSEDNTIYKKITCTLYENYNDTKTKISSCDEKNNKSLEEFLKEVNISVDHYSSNCKKLTSNTLSLEIMAYTEKNKAITYTIPIKLNDTCKQ